MTSEKSRETALAAQELMGEIAVWLSGQGVDRETLFVALQMLMAHVAVQMGVSFEVLMSSMAQNVPLFYKKWAEVEAARTEKPEPGLVFILDDFRKPKE